MIVLLTLAALDAAFNATAKARAESILSSNNVTFQSNLYYAAPHGFAVRVNQSIPQQAYAKQASFIQAVTWFDACKQSSMYEMYVRQTLTSYTYL